MRSFSYFLRQPLTTAEFMFCRFTAWAMRLELKSGNIFFFWFAAPFWRFQLPLEIHKIYCSKIWRHDFVVIVLFYFDHLFWSAIRYWHVRRILNGLMFIYFCLLIDPSTFHVTSEPNTHVTAVIKARIYSLFNVLFCSFFLTHIASVVHINVYVTCH